MHEEFSLPTLEKVVDKCEFNYENFSENYGIN